MRSDHGAPPPAVTLHDDWYGPHIDDPKTISAEFMDTLRRGGLAATFVRLVDDAKNRPGAPADLWKHAFRHLVHHVAFWFGSSHRHEKRGGSFAKDRYFLALRAVDTRGVCWSKAGTMIAIASVRRVVIREFWCNEVSVGRGACCADLVYVVGR